jgi:hypothetical protein
MSPEQMVAEIKRQQNEIEYLKRQRADLDRFFRLRGARSRAEWVRLPMSIAVKS